MPRLAIMVALCGLVCSTVSSAPPGTNAAARVRAFSKLPEWSGVWLSAAWPLNAAGRVVGGEAQLRRTLQLLRRPPYNSQWAAKYDQVMSDKAVIAAKDASFKACTRSFPGLMEAPYMFQVVMLPEETLIVFENDQVRHIHTDGRKHPGAEDLWPTRLGDSIGHWDHDTLIIDTVARMASEPMAPRAWAAVLSDQARITERLHRASPDELVDEMTIEDPVALAGPWQMTFRFNRVKELDRLIPQDCTENDRNPVVDGKLTITPR
jgi:hypothetical protein